MCCQKVVRPARKRQYVEHLNLTYDVSFSRACRAMLLQRSSYYYKPTKNSQAPLRLRIKELAAARVRYGYRRIYILLRREGWRINHKRVYRLYCEEGLHLRSKRPKRRISAAHRANRPEATRVNESWRMGFVSDNLFNGRRIRSLTVVDNFSRECLGIWVDQSIRSEDVVKFMRRISSQREIPQIIRFFNSILYQSIFLIWL